MMTLLDQNHGKSTKCQLHYKVGILDLIIIIIIIIMEAFIKRRIPGKTTCSKALQYNSNKVVIKLKLY